MTWYNIIWKRSHCNTTHKGAFRVPAIKEITIFLDVCVMSITIRMNYMELWTVMIMINMICNYYGMWVTKCNCWMVPHAQWVELREKVIGIFTPDFTQKILGCRRKPEYTCQMAANLISLPLWLWRHMKAMLVLCSKRIFELPVCIFSVIPMCDQLNVRNTDMEKVLLSCDITTIAVVKRGLGQE